VRAPAPRPRPSPEPAPRGPRRFRVIDVMSQSVLAEDADVRTTLALLRGVRSLVDVRIHVWDAEADDWRPLTLAEQKSLWDFRGSEDESEPLVPKPRA
jgi:hypothetical protein